MEKKPNQMLKRLGLLTVIVGDLFGLTLAGLGIGYLAHLKLGMPEWTIAITMLAGLFLAFYRIFKIVKKISQ